MKSLNEIIKESMEKFTLPDWQSKFRTFDEFMDLNNVNEKTITDEQIEHYYRHNWNNWYGNSITENIYTHPADDFIKKFKETFSDDMYIDIYKDPLVKKTYNTTMFLYVDKENPFVDDKSIVDFKLIKSEQSSNLQMLLDYYNYYITLVEWYKEINKYLIYLEPLYTKNMMKRCKTLGGKLYHVTKKTNIESIIRTGLRPKVGKTKDKNGYRYFPEKIFLVMNGESIEDTIKSVNVTILENIRKDEKYSIIEINIRNHVLPVFDDNATADKNSVYTFNAIDPTLITNVWDSFEKFKRSLEDNERH